MAETLINFPNFSEEVANLALVTKNGLEQIRIAEDHIKMACAEKTTSSCLPNHKKKASITTIQKYLESEECEATKQKISDAGYVLKFEVMVEAAMTSKKFSVAVNKDGLLFLDQALCYLLVIVEMPTNEKQAA